MRRYALVVLCLALATGFACAETKPPKPATKVTPAPAVHKTGDITGAVTSIEAMKTTDKGLLIVVKVTGTGQSLILEASPQNRSAYSTSGGLKVGDKVRAGWMSDATSEKKWITQISVIPDPSKPAPPKTETPKGESKTGEVTGNVTGVDTQKAEQGLLLMVKVNGETFYAAPQNSSVYGTSGELKNGEKVHVTWKSEFAADKKWISQIQIVPKPVKPPTPTKPGK